MAFALSGGVWMGGSVMVMVEEGCGVGDTEEKRVMVEVCVCWWVVVMGRCVVGETGWVRRV